MTDKEKLQQLFDAALRSPAANDRVVLKRAFPSSSLHASPAAVATASVPPAPVTPAFATSTPAAVAPQPVFEAAETIAQPPIETIDAAEPAAAPMPAYGALDDAASTELAALLDAQMKRKSSRRKIEAVVTLLIVAGAVIGGAVCFVQSPARLKTTGEAIRDIRSIGDAKDLADKYQQSLDKIASRGQQIDQASTAMGVDVSKVDNANDTMDAEMRQMMGEEGGKTFGERNKTLQASFGKHDKENQETPDANKTKSVQ